MKVLLVAINSKYIHSNLAVYSLKAYHDSRQEPESRAEVEIAEYTINQNIDDIIGDIYKKRPDVIAFSCYIWNISQVHTVAGELNKLLPNADIWLGGPEVTYDSRLVLESHPYLRGIMTGEGEQTFLELCNAYESGNQEAIFSLKQTTVRIGLTGSEKNKESQIVVNPNRPLLSMDDLPFIYSPKFNDMAAFEHKIIYYESSRGCPFGCSYCLSSVEKSVRFRGLSLVLPELQFFLDAKVPQVKFVDRTFNCDHDRTMKILEYLKEHDNGITNFHFEIAADLLRKDEMEVMAQLRPGLIQLEIGVQSANPITIDEIDRTMDLEELSEIVKSINEHRNIHQHLDLIAGLPYENIESFEQSFNRVYALCPSQLQLGFLKVLKGSKMHQKAEEYGIVYQSRPPYEVLYTKWMTYDDILKLKQLEEMVEVYYNSDQYQYTITALTQYDLSAYQLFASLAQWYDVNGLFDRKHSRITRYSILYDFIQGYLTKKNRTQDILPLQQLLVFDLYCRENLKTRPAFAVDINPMKHLIRSLYESSQAASSAHIEPFENGVQEWLKAQGASVVNEMVVSVKCNNEKDREHLNRYTWILFDYGERDDISYAAKTTILIPKESS